jgi:hypothetical protein
MYLGRFGGDVDGGEKVETEGKSMRFGEISSKCCSIDKEYYKIAELEASSSIWQMVFRSMQLRSILETLMCSMQ